MGNIYRKVDICGLTADGKRLGCVRTDALVDDGATITVISTGIARRLKGRTLRGITARIEGREIPLKLTGVTLDAPGCTIDALAVAVDNDLVARAGVGRDGSPVEVILGHDYTERQRAAIRHGERGSEIVCKAAPLASLAGTRRKRRK